MKRLSYLVLSLGLLACSQVDSEESEGPSRVSSDSFNFAGAEFWRDQQYASRVEFPLVWSRPGGYAQYGLHADVGGMPVSVHISSDGAVHVFTRYMIGEFLEESSLLFLESNVGAVSNDTVDRVVVEHVGNEIVVSMSRRFACDWEGCSWSQEIERLPVGTPDPSWRDMDLRVGTHFGETSTAVCTGNDSGRALLFQTPIVDGIQMGEGGLVDPYCALYQKDGAWRGVVDLVGEAAI